MAVPRFGGHPRGMSTPRGFTLLELMVVLGLLALLLAISAPRLVRWRDAAAVRAARDDVATSLARVRLAAVAAGGAALVLDPAGHRIWTRTATRDTAHLVDLRGRYGVALDVGADGPVELRFDGLGIGRIASRRIILRRREAEAGLTVSAYGRARRW